MAQSKLLVRVGANLDALNAGLKSAENKLKRFSAKMDRLGSDLTTKVSLPIIGVGAAAVTTFAQFDRLEKGLATLNGSAEGGRAAFARLNKIVLDTRTTLDLKTAALGAQRLQGAGLSAQFAERTIKQLGIAATVSGSSIDDVGGVIRQFTQIVGKGKIEQEDLNTILDRMPALGAVIKEEFGSSTAEGIRATGISMESFVGRLTTAIEQNQSFQNVQGGLAKAFESFANAVSVGIRPLGEAIAKALNLEQNLARLSDFITRTSQAFTELSPNTQRLIIGFAAAAAAAGPLLLAVSSISKIASFAAGGLSLITGSLSSLSVLALKAGTVISNIGVVFTSGVARALLFTKALGAIKVALAALTGPVGIVIAIGAAIFATYQRSETFRKSVSKLANTFVEISSKIGNVLLGLIQKIGFDVSGLGDVFNGLFGIVAGVFTGITEYLTIVLEGFGALAKSFKLLLEGEFSKAGSSFLEGIKKVIPVSALVTEGERLGAAFSGAFNDVTSKSLTGENSFFDDLSGVSAHPPPLEDITFDSNNAGSVATSQSSEAYSLYSGQSETIINDLTRISEQAQRTGTSLREMAANTGLQSELGKSIQDLGLKVELTGSQIQSTSEGILANYAVQIENINNKSIALGATFDANTARINATTEAINIALNEGFSPLSDTVVSLQSELIGLQQGFDDVAEKQAQFDKFNSAISKIGSEIEDLASRGALSFKSFASTAISAIGDVIGALIKQGVAAAVANAFKNPAGVVPPVGLALAGIAGAGASALFKTIVNGIAGPKLKDGGIIPPGFSGDRFPALLNSGEAVIPIDRLLEAVAAGGGSGEFVLRGQDLVIAMERASYSRNRITGR